MGKSCLETGASSPHTTRCAAKMTITESTVGQLGLLRVLKNLPQILFELSLITCWAFLTYLTQVDSGVF
jgi:hypothetical protein